MPFAMNWCTCHEEEADARALAAAKRQDVSSEVYSCICKAGRCATTIPAPPKMDKSIFRLLCPPTKLFQLSTLVWTGLGFLGVQYRSWLSQSTDLESSGLQTDGLRKARLWTRDWVFSRPFAWGHVNFSFVQLRRNKQKTTHGDGRPQQKKTKAHSPASPYKGVNVYVAKG